MNRLALRLLAFLLLPSAAIAQDSYGGQLHGNFQLDGQLYLRDEGIDPTGEFYPDERFLGQGYANFVYTDGDFSGGLRYENYQNVMLGFPEGYRGEGITYRYLQFKQDNLDVTVGSFYEQFGSGMVFRSYEERGLGYDNAMDGVRVKANLAKGVYFKGVLGRQRFYFEKSPGILRGVDAEINLSERWHALDSLGLRWTIGASYMSKYQRANDPFLVLPENVAAAGVRSQLMKGPWVLNTEFVHKANDPSADNGYIYKDGNGFIANLSYSKNGLGVIAGVKRIDNMSFRSDRNGSTIDMLVNYLSPTTEVHTYALPALYQYATQINGEEGIQLEANYRFKRKSKLGGKYGTLVSINYSAVQSIDKDYVASSNDTLRTLQGYYSDPMERGTIPYFHDLNFKISKKVNRSFKYNLTYLNLHYNRSVLEDGLSDEPMLSNPENIKTMNADVIVLETLYKVKSKHYLRNEFQLLSTQDDRGSMAMALVEYSIAPHWFFSVQDIYNYGNPDPDQQLHYPLASVVYTQGTSRFQLSYGRQQRGIFCVGGVCRVVPPSNGVSFSLTTSF
ncbi:MAG: DUF6029 family protein [Schleiferiaceae bacterium]|nr:DUF6029 family protein [Schleiferiaceae bacterium]